MSSEKSALARNFDTARRIQFRIKGIHAKGRRTGENAIIRFKKDAHEQIEQFVRACASQ